MLEKAKGVVSVCKVNATKAVALTIFILLMPLAEAACLTEGARNYNLRIFIYWTIVAAPMLVKVLRIESSSLISLILVGQVVGYLFYESGVSRDCNIRIDIVFAAVSVVWMLFRLSSLKGK